MARTTNRRDLSTSYLERLTYKGDKAKKTVHREYDNKVIGLTVRVMPSGSKKWQYRYTKPDGKVAYHTLGNCDGLTPDKAREHCQTVLIPELLKGVDPVEKKASESYTVATLVDNYLANFAKLVAGGTKSQGTLNKYSKIQAPHLVSKWGSRHPDSIEEADCAELYTDTVATKGRSAAANLVIFAKAVFNWGRKLDTARGMDRNRVNPWTAVKLPSYQLREVTLPEEKVPAMFDAISKLSPLASAGIPLFLETGLRHGTLCRMRWEQIDWRSQTIKLPSKGGKVLSVALSDEATRLLRSVRDLNLASPWVFPRKADFSKPRRDFHGAWQRVCRLAGIQGVTIHDLRRTWASWLSEGGASVHTIMAAGGWSSIAMTQKYCHISAKAQAQAVSGVSDRLAAARTGTE